jgi:transcriptional regulator with XRE-family HTH domain
MGKKARPKQERLAGKLLQIRNALGLSQSEMLRRLELEEEMVAARISEFELGKNEPPLKVLLGYARVANVWTDVLIDDELDLPDKLPSRTKSTGVRRRR